MWVLPGTGAGFPGKPQGSPCQSLVSTLVVLLVAALIVVVVVVVVAVVVVVVVVALNGEMVGSS